MIVQSAAFRNGPELKNDCKMHQLAPEFVCFPGQDGTRARPRYCVNWRSAVYDACGKPAVDPVSGGYWSIALVASR